MAKKITANFTGRQAGAIGIVYKISDMYIVESVDEFKSKLYEDYDVIRDLKLSGCTDTEFQKANFVPVRSRSKRVRKSDNATYVIPEKVIE